MADAKISALTNYTPPLDADVVPIVDTANVTTKKVTWANIKATLKTYFDTLYPSGSGTSSGTNTGDQTITNSSDATSHTVTLSASGGSVQFIEGSNITLTTGGTGSTGTVTIAASGSVGASTALDNLAAVAINTSLISDTDSTDSIGSTAVRWLKGWFDDIETTNMPTVGGTAILTSLTAPQFTTVELGHASDTTLSRASAGVVAVEGVTVPTISSTNTLTNKRVTPRVGTTTSSATPTINTDNVDYYSLTAQTADITSFTTNLSGTPTDGQKLWISITGTGARAITWGSSFEASTIALPTTTVSTNRLDVGFVWNAATSKWRCIGSV